MYLSDFLPNSRETNYSIEDASQGDTGEVSLTLSGVAKFSRRAGENLEGKQGKII